jgi:hypothetical protein
VWDVIPARHLQVGSALRRRRHIGDSRPRRVLEARTSLAQLRALGLLQTRRDATARIMPRLTRGTAAERGAAPHAGLGGPSGLYSLGAVRQPI